MVRYLARTIYSNDTSAVQFVGRASLSDGHKVNFFAGAALSDVLLGLETQGPFRFAAFEDHLEVYAKPSPRRFDSKGSLRPPSEQTLKKYGTRRVFLPRGSLELEDILALIHRQTGLLPTLALSPKALRVELPERDWPLFQLLEGLRRTTGITFWIEGNFLRGAKTEDFVWELSPEDQFHATRPTLVFRDPRFESEGALPIQDLELLLDDPIRRPFLIPSSALEAKVEVDPQFLRWFLPDPAPPGSRPSCKLLSEAKLPFRTQATSKRRDQFGEHRSLYFQKDPAFVTLSQAGNLLPFKYRSRRSATGEWSGLYQAIFHPEALQ